MAESICEYCGKKISKGIYCSKSCAAKGGWAAKRGKVDPNWNWKKVSKELYECRYNPEVKCENRICTNCGWNPEVAKARLEKLMEVKV